MSDLSGGNGTKTTQSTVKQLRLNSIKNTRRTLARLMKDFHARPEADVQRFRSLIYGVKAMAELFGVEAQLEVVSRLDAIDRRLEELKKGESNA